jgi:plasmid stability protein
MKATIDFDEGLYRRLKVEAARRGRTVRDLVAEGVRHVLGIPETPATAVKEEAWFGVLGGYGRQQGRHDLKAIRESVAKGRTRKKSR